MAQNYRCRSFGKHLTYCKCGKNDGFSDVLCTCNRQKTSSTAWYEVPFCGHRISFNRLSSECLVQSPSEIKPSKSIQLQTFRPKLSKLVQTCNVMCSRSNDRFWNSSIPFQSPFPAAPFLAISSFGLRLWAKAREKNKYCNLYLRYLWGDTENSLWMLNVRMSIGSSCSEGTAYWEMSPRINIL